MIRTTSRWLSTLVIVAAVTGCDNVAWGGVDVRLEPPPDREPIAEEGAAQPEAPVLPDLPAGPVLFRVDRTGGRTSASPVGEIAGASLVSLSAEREHPGFREHFARERMVGREFILFADGVRVGRFLAGDSVRVDGEACTEPPTVTGVIEVIPEAAQGTRFLALETSHVTDAEWGPYAPTTVDQGWRATAANVAGTVIMDAGTRWPPSMGGARGDVHVARFRADEPPLLAGTYLYQDQMAITEAPEGAYAFFYLAENRGTGYRFTYYWLRAAGEDGKGAPRYYGHLDWNGDGRDEVVLEVLGADSRWHAALARTETGFELTYQDPCGSPEQQAARGE